MLRQYHAPRFRGGDNPLRVGVIAAGSIYYLQNEAFFRDRTGGRAICRTPWLVEAFLNGTAGAARRNRDTGLWDSVHRAGRSDMGRVRSLRDRRIVREIAVRTLIVHDDLGLWQQPTAYPSLPDAEHVRASRAARAVAPRRMMPPGSLSHGSGEFRWSTRVSAGSRRSRTPGRFDMDCGAAARPPLA